jgi:HEPN domain-containing protein
MPDPEGVTAVASEWVKKAENDLKTATHSLRLGKGCPTDTVSFHAQQAVEKYLKALLSAHGIPFPKTHNIGRLLELLPVGARPNLSKAEQNELTDFASGPRYPGGAKFPCRRAACGRRGA